MSANDWGCTVTGLTDRWAGYQTILHDVALTIKPGHQNRWPLVGPSGGGKSTLLYLLSAMKWPTQGTIKWTLPTDKPNAQPLTYEWGPHGQGLTAAAAVKLRQRYFGVAFQDSTLLPHLTVRENLTYPLLLLGISQAEADKTAYAQFERLLTNDSQAFWKRFPHELSGGERQRVALVQTLVHNPRVIFADEPTGSLDPHTRQQVMSVLKEWLETDPTGRCFIWVTHHTFHSQDPDLLGVQTRLHIQNGQINIQTFNPTQNCWE